MVFKEEFPLFNGSMFYLSAVDTTVGLVHW